MTLHNPGRSPKDPLTLQRHKGINRIYDSIFAADDLDKKLNTICDGIVSTFEADFCRIWMIRQGDQCNSGCPHALNPDERHICQFRDLCLHLAASSGRYTHLDGFHGRVPYGCYKIGRIASGKMETFLSNDVTHDSRVHDHQWAATHDLVSFAGYQLRDHQGQVNGVLALFSQHTLSPEEHAILENMANSTAHIIQVDLHRLKLEDLARQQTRHLEKLLIFSQSLSSSRDIGSLYRKITALPKDLLRLDFSTLMILSDDQKSLVIRDTIGFDQSMIDTFVLVEGQGLSTYVLLKKTPATVTDFATENRFEIPPVIEKKKITSSLCVPMMISEDIFGVLIGHTHEKRNFSAAEISLYQSFANQAGVALKNMLHMQKLQASEQKLRTIIDTLPSPLFYKNAEGVYLDCNAAFSDFLGVSKEQIINSTVHEVFPKAQADLYRQADIDLLQSTGKQTYEAKMRHADATLHDVLVHKATWGNQDGKAQGLVGIMLDITKRKQAEQELAAEKERLAVTLKSIGDGVITTDTNGRIVLLNRIAEKITGWRQTEAAGRPMDEVFKIVHAKTRQPCESPVQKVLAQGTIIAKENHTVLIAKNGEDVHIADSGAPIRDRDDVIIGVVLVFRDITNQLKTEEELLKMKKLESVGVLAGGIAHDFNNILSGILGNLELAGLCITENSRAASLLANARKATLRAAKLTDQLLTFSKGGDPVKETTSLAEIIRDSAEFVLHGSNISCDYSISEELWLVNVDSGQISQVIQNIIINAIHAMPEGGKITVTCNNVEGSTAKSLQIAHKSDFVRLTIQDSGIGIPSETIEKIFDPYFSTKQNGNGLGLAICHSIINKHDGHILVQSEPDQGTTFTIYLPASIVIGAPTANDQKTKTVARALRILVMDDEEMLRIITEAQLTQLGHEVILTKDGSEAISKYKEMQKLGTPVDLIFMDLTIPGGMGGKEAVREILKLNPDARVIVASGYSNDPIMANYKEYGFTASLAKPFDLKTLNDTLTFVCE